MEKLAQIFKTKREAQNIKLEEAAKKTGIPLSWLMAIEAGEYQKVPAGYLNIYLRDYALFLGINVNKALALFRRDYPGGQQFSRRQKINQKKKFLFLKKIEFNLTNIFSLLGLGSWQLISFLLIFVFAVGYLVFQYYRFNQPPPIELFAFPQEVFQEQIVIRGKTDPNAVVKINDQPVFVTREGIFEKKIILIEGKNIVVFEAQSPSGRKNKFEKEVVFKKNFQ